MSTARQMADGATVFVHAAQILLVWSMGLPLTVSEANSQERAILLSITDKPVWQCWNSLWHFCWTVHALVCGRVHTIHDLWHHDLQLPWPCPWSQVQAWNYPTLSTVFWRMENKLDHKNERNTTTSLVTPQSNLMCIYFLSSNFSIMFLPSRLYKSPMSSLSAKLLHHLFYQSSIFWFF